MALLIGKMDGSRKLYNKVEGKVIPNFQQLAESNSKEEGNNGKEIDKITIKGCSKFNSAIFDSIILESDHMEAYYANCGNELSGIEYEIY
ncbi:unnamed protein product [Wuchereria bancrofti]|uniref:Uncharacterized protein n=1 Tax=Wuchereria bancrofti TaxID=6293 RepID=A0A3P7DPE4_WUCBA|nr:unnamed protein product [Wuchereria bancrofti]